MKKFLCAAFLATASLSLQGDILTEIKAGYFVPFDTVFNRIYGGGGIYGLEVSTPLNSCLNAWVSGSYFTQTGHSLGQRYSTHIQMAPFGVGVQYFRNTICKSKLYIGIGGLATYLHTTDNSPFVFHSVSKWGPGLVGKLGLQVDLGSCFFGKLFSDFTYTRIPFYNNRNDTLVRYTANLSGWSAGIAIGYRFSNHLN